MRAPLWKRLAVLAVTLALAALAAEGLARMAEARSASALELDHFRSSPVGQRFLVDPEFGFRPVFGGDEYDEHGIVHNSYPWEKDPAQRRVLFIGDSVTKRARIVNALRDLHGDERHEYWNAGVESFNLVQTVRYFLRFAHVCEPDQVVFTFHHNDFQTTPVVYRDANGALAVFAPSRPRSDVVPWLFRYSILYRRLLKTLDRETGQRAIEDEMRQSLRRLQAWTEERGVRLSVLVFPALAPPAEQYRDELDWYETAVEMCTELGLEVHGLLPPLEEALADGIEPRESPTDRIHPNDEVSAYFARYLSDRGLL